MRLSSLSLGPRVAPRIRGDERSRLRWVRLDQAIGNSVSGLCPCLVCAAKPGHSQRKRRVSIGPKTLVDSPRARHRLRPSSASGGSRAWPDAGQTVCRLGRQRAPRPRFRKERRPRESRLGRCEAATVRRSPRRSAAPRRKQPVRLPVRPALASSTLSPGAAPRGRLPGRPAADVRRHRRPVQCVLANVE